MESNLLLPYSVLECVSPIRISQHAFSKIAQHSMRRSTRVRKRHGYFRYLALPNISLCNLAFGSEVTIEGPAPQDYYYLQYVLAGQMVVQSTHANLAVDPSMVAMISPFHAVALHHSEDCCKLVIRIRRDFMERELAMLLGFPLKDRIEFSPSLYLDQLQQGSVIRTIEHVCQEVSNPDSIFRVPQGSIYLERLLASAMLLGIKHSYSSEIELSDDSLIPVYLRRAERYIESHMSVEISLDDLINISGTGLNLLYKAFKTYRNATPIGYLKRLRLQKAKRELENPMSLYKTIADVACAMGMRHLGNFSADYKRVFGELPSDTLKRARKLNKIPH